MTETKHVQALHAAISRRDWHATEIAANAIRDASPPEGKHTGVVEENGFDAEAFTETASGNPLLLNINGLQMTMDQVHGFLTDWLCRVP
jgi:hypothetical protein